MFNMMIMDSQLLGEYCTWLFDVLFELDRRVNDGRVEMPPLSAFQARFYGRVSEIIFNVWLEYNITAGKIAKQEIHEIPCRFMENEHLLKKAAGLLMAKFFGKRYDNGNESDKR
jgi:hypothetical protein